MLGGGPGARGVTRRLLLGGSLRATIAAGVVGRMSILDVLAAERTLPRRYEGELIEERYGIAHRLRDGSLEIPTLAPEGPLHDAIVLGGGVSGLMAAWDLVRGGLEDVVLYEKEDYIGGNARKGHANGTDYTCATWSLVRPKDPFLKRLYADLDMVTGYEPDGTPKIRRDLIGPGPEYNVLIDGTWHHSVTGGDADTLHALPFPEKDRRDLMDFYRELQDWGTSKGSDGRPAFAMPVEDGSRDPDLLALDRITMKEYATRKGWGAITLREVDDWSSSDIGGGIGDVSAYAFWAFNGLGQGGEDITLPGGNAWVAQRMEDKV